MLLAIDTSTGTSVAVIDADGAVRAERGTDDTMRHAEVIGPLIAECLAALPAGLPANEAGDAADEVDAVVAGIGPGPFTGLRVGMAAARAFAWGRGIPVLPVASHDAVAFAHYRATGGGRSIAVVTDARRREVYYTIYGGTTAGGVPVRSTGPALARPNEFDLGSALRLDTTAVSAAALGALAVAIRAEGIEFGDGHPLYLRSPDVTMRSKPKRVSG